MQRWYKQHLETYSGIGLDDDERLDRLKCQLSFYSPENPEVSVVIPAWNEEGNILPTLASLAASATCRQVEIIVINNNSTDRTQQLLNRIGVRNFFQAEQGIAFARQLGLEVARGKYHLCADADTLYPPGWIDAMVGPMHNQPQIVGVYGRYCFIPAAGKGRRAYWIYEFLTGIIVRWRRKHREYINVLGFNMGFVTDVARATAGFQVIQARRFDNAAGSDDHVHESEDGRMAVRLKEQGKLKLITDKRARVFTSSRRLEAEGGLVRAFSTRFSNYAKVLFNR